MNKALHSLAVIRLNKSYIYLSALSILIGGFIYILFRTSEPVFFNWIQSSGLGSWIKVIRLSTLNWSNNLPDWLVFSLPNGLWAFAYALIITNIWGDSDVGIRYLWIASIPILVLGFELLQYSGIVSGTFCIDDLILGSAGLFCGILIGLKNTKAKRYEKSVK